MTNPMTILSFAAAFAATGDFHAAVGVARDKAEATRYLKARFGRATYVAEAQGQELPDRLISEHANLVTPEGLRQIEAELFRAG